MKINQQLNIHLKRESELFKQYLNLMSQKGLSIAQGYQHEAHQAQLDFLTFYLDSVTTIIASYANKDEAELILNEQFSATKALIAESDGDADQCIKKMEETSNYWSSLCY